MRIRRVITGTRYIIQCLSHRLHLKDNTNNETIKNWNSLNSLQLRVASITDSNIEFKAHDRNIDSIY